MVRRFQGNRHAFFDGAGAVPSEDPDVVGWFRPEINTGSEPSQRFSVHLPNLEIPIPPARVAGGGQLSSLSQKGTVRGVGHSMVMRVRWLPRKQVEDIPDLAR